MTDTTITKVDSSQSPKGAAGQKYLACGKSMSMRLWENEPVKKDKAETKHDYETLGYVIKGKAELHLESQMVLLSAGDSWVVPKGASHRYIILEDFSAVESTSPPAELHDRTSSDNANSPKDFFAESAKDAAAMAEVKPVKDDSAEMKAKAATESKADAEAKPEDQDHAEAKPEVEDKAQQVQGIVSQIPRTESTPTSNSSEKQQKPAEHVDLAKEKGK